MPAPAADLLFRAFADETRLRILRLLAQGELCVGDLVTILGVPQPTASRHLAYLRRAGLVKTRRSGLWHHYRLAQARGRLHGRLVRCLTDCFDDIPALRKDEARAAKVRASGGCCPR